MSDREPPEVTKRVRRIETRLTQMMEHLGIPIQRELPIYSKAPGELGRVKLPAPGAGLKSIMDAIPADRRNDPVLLYVGDEYVAMLDCRTRS